MRSRWLGVSSFAAVLSLALSGGGGGGGAVPRGDSNGESEIVGRRQHLTPKCHSLSIG